ncbi:hypothetical protein [Ochrobactrum sp. BTU1]|uniref:hypothetical protein n=1 Tax=Ochrobactrum sp. BTU1 TaxID=2840456 RepID=UPI001C04460D|nr:hypothetical protein KMS41_20135 [Ochrobactrum sp. BTU1]
MKKILLIITAILCATPGYAAADDDDAAGRERDRNFFKFSTPLNTESDETRITDKGCIEHAIPASFIDKYGNDKGMGILWAINNNIISKEILNSNRCTCEMLYPKWDKAIEIYEKDFAKLDAWAPSGTATNKYLAQYRSHSQENIMQARQICSKMGVW